MKQKIVYIISIALLSVAFTSCEDSKENFDNKLYISSAEKTASILLQGNDTDNASFKVEMPTPEDRDVLFTIAPDASALSTYNEAYYDNAELLTEAYYTISDKEVTIAAGNTKSTEITVSFNNLTALDRQKKYVLPVSINSPHVGILQSARTIYYVIKGAALINVVGDIEENNVYVDWANSADFREMRQFTAEVLIRPRNFDKMISTVMGIEGKFLIRIGDAPIPYNQLQVATSNGNFSNSDLAIPTNEWTHIAVTYDADKTEINVFINGKNKLTAKDANVGTVDWGVPHSDESDGKPRCFWIGYSYDNNRYLAGEISECRIWNKVLTAADLNAENHFYYADPASEGLIAYWKFNDGGGSTVKDYSKNGNHATASNTLKWNKVEIGE